MHIARRRRSTRLQASSPRLASPRLAKKKKKEELEQKKTMDIIDKLSKKYLKKDTKDKSTSKAKSTPKNKTKKSTKAKDRPKETSAASEDQYDFDLSDEPTLRLRLFTEEDEENKNKNKTKKGRGKNDQQKRSGKIIKENTKKEEKTLKSSTPLLLTQKDGNKRSNKSSGIVKYGQTDKKRPFWETFTNIKPKSTTSKKRKTSCTEPKPKKKRTEIKSDNLMTEKRQRRNTPVSASRSTGDSGVYLSPPVLRTILSGPTSTPNFSPVPVATPSMMMENEIDSALDESLFSLPSSVSPVKQAKKTSETDIASPSKLFSPIFERSYSHISVSELSMNEKKQKIKKKGRYSTTKVNKWAEQLNSEFEEIESYELSIEA